MSRRSAAALLAGLVRAVLVADRTGYRPVGRGVSGVTKARRVLIEAPTAVGVVPVGRVVGVVLPVVSVPKTDVVMV